MLKFFSLISLSLIYLSASAQKASYYKDPSADLNKFNYFFLQNCPIDAHDLTSPYFNKNGLSDTDMNYFMIYNELSLKNLVIIDDHADVGTFIVSVYQGNTFDQNIQTPQGYRPKKPAKNSLFIDMVDGGTKTLVWRGWIDLSKIKYSNTYQLYQKAISAILNNLQIQPIISE